MTGILQSLLGSVSSAAASATDAFFNLVTLLLPGNGTNGAQNNTFLDSSSNNFTITRNGNTTQGTFSPFSQTGWSNFFDGSSAYLTVADNAALDLGTGNFTIEAWIFATSVSPATNFTIVAKGGSSATGTWQFDITSGSKLRLQYDTAGAITSTASLVANTWNHVVAVREGTGSNQTKIYINGTNDGTGTVSSDLGDASTVKIGLNRDGTTYFPGYISNLRIVKGTAVYTSAFTPPTSALTAITNTSLLTCQSNRFIDNSSNAFAITVNGTPSVQAFSPFAPTAAYDAATNGGSGYFDGAGDYLTVADTTSLEPGTGDFCFETWVYHTSASNGSSFDFYTDQLSGGLAVYRNLSNKIQVDSDGVVALLTSASNVPFNSWAHIAVTRSGTTLRIFLNGVVDASTTNSTNIAGTGAISYGSQPAGGSNLDGYLASTRFVKGSAVYTSGFSVPTAPLTAISGTQILLNYTNAGITDATAKNDLETVGNAQISTTQSKFGGSSMSFPATNGNYAISPPNQPNLLFGTGQFTIELWVYPTAFTNTAAGIVGYGLSGGYVDWNLELNTSGTLLYIDNDAGRVSASSNLSLNTWTHIAVVRTSTAVTVYFNGTSVATYSTINNISGSSTSARLYVGTGAQVPASRQFIGYIDDLRITKGYARYTANFSVPTSAFPVQ